MVCRGPSIVDANVERNSVPSQRRFSYLHLVILLQVIKARDEFLPVSGSHSTASRRRLDVTVGLTTSILIISNIGFYKHS